MTDKRSKVRPMKAFAVFVNGKRVCTAGIGPNGVLSTIITWAGGGSRRTAAGFFSLHVGGLDSRTDEHVRWQVPEVKVGDEVTVKILEAARVNPEHSRCKAERNGAPGG